MAVSSDIFLKEDTLGNAPIQGASVAVYNPTTYSLVAQGVSDVNGRASFLLPGSTGSGTPYEVRAFKSGVIFLNPFMVSIVEPPVTTNKFDLEGTPMVLPVSLDQRVCRCTGRIFGVNNAPIPNASFRISSLIPSGTQMPKVLDGNLISQDSVVVHSNDDGVISVDLIRNGKYYVSFSGEEDVVWPIIVPDRASVNLTDLVHPVPAQLNWDQNDAPGDAITIHIGEVYRVGYTLTFSDYSERGLGDGVESNVDVWNVNPDIIDLTYSDFSVYVTGVSIGEGEVTASNSPYLTPTILPTPVLSFNSLRVTVIP